MQSKCTEKLHSALFIASFAECPRVWKMASALAEKSYRVTIIEWDRSSQLPALENINGICIRRMKLKAPYGLKLFFLLPIWWLYSSLFLLLHNFEVVQTQNLDNLLPTLIFSWIKKVKLVYDVADFYGESYVPQKISFLRKMVCQLERLLIRRVSLTIIPDESRLQQIKVFDRPVYTIYNSPPDILLDKLLLSPEVIKKKFTILYAGIFEVGRGLDLLIHTVGNMPDIELLFAGFGNLEKELSKAACDYGNIRFLGKIPYQDVLTLTLFCDCVVAFYDPKILNNIYASPNKLFEAMMCGKPIITNDGTTMAKIVKNQNCGLLISYGNSIELKQALILAKNNPELMELMAVNARKSYLQKYDWSLMKSKLLHLYACIGLKN